MALIFPVEFFTSRLRKKQMPSRSKLCCPEHHITGTWKPANERRQLGIMSISYNH